MFARSHKMRAVSTRLTQGRRWGERLSLSPHGLGGRRLTLLDHSRPQSPSFLGHVVLKRWALEAVVTRCPKFRTSGDECAEVTNITARAHRGFFSLTAPLGKKFYFLSPLQRVDSLGCFENTGFTQLGFINNLESKGDDISKNQLNTLLGCRTEAINRQIIV